MVAISGDIETQQLSIYDDFASGLFEWLPASLQVARVRCFWGLTDGQRAWTAHAAVCKYGADYLPVLELCSASAEFTGRDSFSSIASKSAASSRVR